jgi:hypothetical protein
MNTMGRSNNTCSRHAGGVSQTPTTPVTMTPAYASTISSPLRISEPAWRRQRAVLNGRDEFALDAPEIRELDEVTPDRGPRMLLDVLDGRVLGPLVFLTLGEPPAGIRLRERVGPVLVPFHEVDRGPHPILGRVFVITEAEIDAPHGVDDFRDALEPRVSDRPRRDDAGITHETPAPAGQPAISSRRAA